MKHSKEAQLNSFEKVGTTYIWELWSLWNILVNFLSIKFYPALSTLWCVSDSKVYSTLVDILFFDDSSDD